MSVDKFYKDSFIVTLSNLATGMIGFIFSIILSKILGAEGLGLYGLIMPIYGLLLGLTTDGLNTAISRISAIYSSKRDFKNINRTISTIFMFILLWSFSIAFLVFINSSNIAFYIIKDTRITNALRIMCPALIFVPMSAIIKGYFYGMGRFKPPAFIDIIEKFFRVTILLGTISLLSLHEVKSTVTAAYFALAAGEITSFTLLYLFYKATKQKIKTGSSRSRNRLQLLFDVLVISSPLCLNGFISSVLSTAATLLLPRRLVHAGFSYNTSLSLIGKFTGMAMNITYLPFIIVNSMLTVLIPDLSHSISNKDTWATENRISQVLKVSYLVGISTLVISLSIPDALGMLFYNRTDLGGMIIFAALTSFASYISSPTYSILNGLGKQNVNLKNSVIVSVEGLVLIYILTGIPAINIYGFGITLVITSITALVLNIYEIRKYCEVKLRISDLVSYTMIGVFSLLALILFNSFMPAALLAINAVLTAVLGFGLVFSLSRFV